MSGSERLARHSPRRVTATILFAVLALCAVLASDALGWLQGPVAFVLLGAAWFLLPTARVLSPRLVINGALALGLIPVLWWVRIDPIGGIGRFGLVLGLVTVSIVLAAGLARSAAIIPTVRPRDAVPILLGAGTVWLLWPLFAANSAGSAFRMVLQSFDGDNVAHFDMFAMIRSRFVDGPGWPVSSDGSAYAYVNYPQHFHALAAFFAEAWKGVKAGSPATEVGLYALATATLLVISVVVFSGAVLSVRAFDRHPLIGGLAAVAASSLVVLGFGGTSIASGFPGFALASSSAVVAVVLATASRRPSLPVFAAIGATALLVAHTWALLAPIPAVAFLAVVLTVPWRSWRARPIHVISRLVVSAIIVGGAVYAAVLVAAAVGPSPATVLATGGGVVPIPAAIPLSIGAVVAVGSAVVCIRTWRAAARPREVITPHAIVFVAVAVGLVVAAGVIAIQLAQVGHLDYYQYKLLDGLTVVFAALAIIEFCVVAVEGGWFARPRSAAPAIGTVAVFTVLLLVASSIIGPGDNLPPGIRFRDALTRSEATADPGAERLLSAARVFAAAPCERPFYVAWSAGDPLADEANQWAMALSGTWTEAGGKITSYLVSAAHGPAAIQALLEADPQRCAVLPQTVKASLPRSVLTEYPDRIVGFPASRPRVLRKPDGRRSGWSAAPSGSGAA